MKVNWEMQACDEDDKLNLDVHVDSGWAKGRERKSTSGGMMMINGTAVKHQSRTPATHASRAVSEYYAGTAEGLGMHALLSDPGLKAEVSLKTDSNAAKATASGRGLEKTKHPELGRLWVQEVINTRRLKIWRVPGEFNLAGHLPKGKAAHEIEKSLIKESERE